MSFCSLPLYPKPGTKQKGVTRLIAACAALYNSRLELVVGCP